MADSASLQGEPVSVRDVCAGSSGVSCSPIRRPGTPKAAEGAAPVGATLVQVWRGPSYPEVSDLVGSGLCWS